MPSPGPVVTSETARQLVAAPAPGRSVSDATVGRGQGTPSPSVDSRAAASVNSDTRGRGTLPTPARTVVAAARMGDGTPAPGTPVMVNPSAARQQTPGPRPAGTPDVKPQPTREGTPAGSPAADGQSTADAEPERTATLAPQTTRREIVIEVYPETFRPPPSGCSPDGRAGAWQVWKSVAWSPDGSQVFYSQGGAIYAATADGARVRQVAATRAAGSDPGKTEHIRVEHDGTRVRTIVYRPVTLPAEQGAGDNLGPMTAFSMSPDGRQVLYSTCAYPRQTDVPAGRPRDLGEYQYDLAVLDVAGGAVRRLTARDTAENFPTWSPDGTRIAFLSGLRRLRTMAPDGSDVRDLTDGTETKELLLHPPQWSPDGQRLAFVAKEAAASQPVLFTIRADGTELRRLAVAVSPPSWSPDGRRLAMARPVGQEAVELITIQADGTDVRPVTDIEGWQFTTGRQHVGPSGWDRQVESIPRAVDAWIETLAWSPAADQILYTCGTGFCVTTTDGTPVGRSPRYADETTVAVRISEYSLAPHPAAAWSPDGSRIAVVSRHVRSSSAVAFQAAYADVILEQATPDWTDVRVLVWEGLGRPVAAGARDLDVAANQAACAAGYVVPQPDANPGLVRDCQVLVGVAPELTRLHGFNWNAGTPIKQWESVTVAGHPPRITELQMGGIWAWWTVSDPGVPVPVALAELTELRVLELGGNQFHGPIPEQWASLKKLQFLSLIDSGVAGPIPAFLGGLSQLRTLNLAHNKLDGSLPPELGQLADLETLVLRVNALSGSIPSEFGRLTHIATLDLSDNRLTGPIPPDLSQLARLETLALSSNDLTGAIPSEWCQLTNASTLSLDRNRLSGPIPDCLGELPNLDRLHLEHNQLTGEIPATLAQANRLDYAALDGNQLTGCVPPGLKVPRRDELGLPDCEAGA